MRMRTIVLLALFFVPLGCEYRCLEGEAKDEDGECVSEDLADCCTCLALTTTDGHQCTPLTEQQCIDRVEADGTMMALEPCWDLCARACSSFTSPEDR